mmetsp:Transcript_17643/g.21155  ORF Transcript_17643/g.21155 Transcript_17643/m.21155 type:complete len:353 (-) Transcript_17643:717-1775(-)|eukprot:CAMPEP_0197847174 /NCGR_PEP_ID=MMETSP1438-20131217/5394_1 /TAXON_ID=1461541 /ORGANISM="Pterosperma sp., Strain CCMP1384" /LENGTH=352 /DNA_ID=CAMNT_0043459021 /DNA_START=155 /DNA_END=1213 /DNA_ORIENTATION=+
MSAQCFTPLAPSRARATVVKASSSSRNFAKLAPRQSRSPQHGLRNLRRDTASQSGRGSLALKAADSDVSLDPIRGSAELGPNCSIDDMTGCTLGDLELMYVDALWGYYKDGKFNLTDEQYDELREELNWQGSGFPTLRRHEVEFVEASIAYARGEPCVSDKKYEELKNKVKADGKREDVTALLLYVKGKELLEEKDYDLLADEMLKLGIDVGLKGASCTLSKTSDDCPNDISKVAQTYAALAIAPTLVGISPFVLLALFGVDVVPAPIAAVAGLSIGAALTYQLINYLELENAEILTGQCPCCEATMRSFFGGPKKDDNAQVKCNVCGTVVTMDRTTKKISLQAGPKFVQSA